MADEKKDANTDPKAAGGAQPESKEQMDSKSLLARKALLEQENRALKRTFETFSPKLLATLQARNKELKSEVEKLEKELILLVKDIKQFTDAGGITEKFQVLKAEALAFCNERQIDPNLWKKLESL